MTRKVASLLAAFAVLGTAVSSQSTPQPGSSLDRLPAWTRPAGPPARDWLIDPSSFKAGVFRGTHPDELVLANGLVARVFRLAPNAATVALDNLVNGEAILRAVEPEAIVELDGRRYEIGGLQGQPNRAFLRSEWVDAMRANPAAFHFTGFEVGRTKARFAWKEVRHHAPGTAWPPNGVSLRLDFAPPVEGAAGSKDIVISVHYELYDGLPCYSKWITIRNGTGKTVVVDRFSSERLAGVERVSEVDALTADGRTAPNVHVETDMAFGSMLATGASRRSYRWLADPAFDTQVNYEKKTPCLLDVGPDLGPSQQVAPGGDFESFRTWVLPFDGNDRERNGLAVRKMYRAIAPWATENPLMMHVRSADEATVTNAVAQAAETGFEMLILSFGSGFDLEDETPSTLALAQRYARIARSRGIEIGSYSLLASRKVGDGHDVVMPPGERPTFGNSPCLRSDWGERYFARLYDFHRTSGFTLLEHDGSYPGDPCAADSHPGHRGLADSRWTQWRTISDFYKWSRAQGLYLNVPDFYFLAGSSKIAMGYRETNWSLPREQQVIHTRQNIFDGTWEKTPSMGWMFVPLTEYQGGGAAATIEPLEQHLDHYERMISSNLALGVQACYRGPRLYDTERTRTMVKRWVDWYKAHRDILESDLVHGRRADARDLDWMLHVNPALNEKGMVVVFNPLDRPVTKTIRVNLYYTGLATMAQISEQGRAAKRFELARDYTIDLPVSVPAQGMNWYIVQ